ncbi:lipopolysaccharide/colanic/teichoic acid biosynthesis glycosyltransferase [Streptomyces sp. B3I7]|uniref:sugar transferase n=1 Tax=Streptomyces sp. B3I7 TaxID=3042269 RepID=UPI0027828386|nr:sugar transferase [Streptomyces sp. B3I7]MDQ0813359.1 lipopolysaccharide/colanic/teichoic acid biosynthesis glycosyltransferase [Streptomyces sp. B3I7]
MTAESTVPSPGGQPREYGHSPVSVVPPREAVDDHQLPTGRRPVVHRPSAALLLAVDAGAALLAGLAVDGTRGHPLVVGALLLGVLTLNARAGLHRPPAVPVLLDELPAVCGRIAVSWCALAALTAAFAPAYALSAHALVLGCVLQAAVSGAGRGTVHWLRRRTLARRPGAALVAGDAATAQRVAAAFLRHPGCGLRPVGVVAPAPAPGGDGLPVLTTAEEVRRAFIQNGVRAVLLVAGGGPSTHPHSGPSAHTGTGTGPADIPPGPEHLVLARELVAAGCALWQVDATPPAYGTEQAHFTPYAVQAPYAGASSALSTPTERLAGFVCRRLDNAGRPGPRLATGAKRALDVLVSGTLLLLVSPLLLGCVLVLRLSDGPGVVFRQERIGKDGLPFTLLKFRTHRPADAHEAATRWSVASEPEMSRFCRFLRRSSLDELLQLWNVFRGDMSLVGPRPERPYFVDTFSQAYPGYAARHRMPVGITGLAQVSGLRGDTSIEDRARFDNAYIDDWSLWQDVCILMRTAAALIRPTGS